MSEVNCFNLARLNAVFEELNNSDSLGDEGGRLLNLERRLRETSVAVLTFPIFETALKLPKSETGDEAALRTGDGDEGGICGTTTTIRLAHHALLFLLEQLLSQVVHHANDADLTVKVCNPETSTSIEGAAGGGGEGL